jgi:DNA-binding response OmpR family regulator
VTILLAEEDEAIRLFLEDNLIADGFVVQTAGDFDSALAQLADVSPDLVVVDVNGRTLGLLDSVRSADASLAVAGDTPVIVLTSKRNDVHRVRMLDRGGDDVIVKPFSYAELLARVRAVLRRTKPRRPHSVLEAGPVRIDLPRRAVSVESHPVEVSALEYELLCKLASEPTRVFTRNELMRDIWGYTTGRSRMLDSHPYRHEGLSRSGGPRGPRPLIFGGRVPSDPHRPEQRAMVENTSPEYRDRRDWEEIRARASRIAAELGAAVPIRSGPTPATLLSQVVPSGRVAALNGTSHSTRK